MSALNVVLTIVGFLFLLATIGIIFINWLSVRENSPKPIGSVAYVICIVAGVALIVFSASFRIIPTGYTGVRSVFGQVKESSMPNGFNWKIPFVETVYQINNKQQDITFGDNKIVSETEERNEVTFTGVTVTYKINPDYSSWIVRNVSDWEDNLISESLIASAIKSTSKTLTPIDVTNRSILEPKAQELVQKSLNQKYGSDVIEITKVIINNAEFDKEYDKKIAQKQQAQMEYEKQVIDNKKNVEKAEADAQAKIKAAEGNAEAKKIEAEGEAKANEILNKSLTEKVLQEKMLSKWNGELPKVTGGSGTIIDIGNIMNNK